MGPEGLDLDECRRHRHHLTPEFGFVAFKWFLWDLVSFNSELWQADPGRFVGLRAHQSDLPLEGSQSSWPARNTHSSA